MFQGCQSRSPLLHRFCRTDCRQLAIKQTLSPSVVESMVLERVKKVLLKVVRSVVWQKICIDKQVNGDHYLLLFSSFEGKGVHRHTIAFSIHQNSLIHCRPLAVILTNISKLEWLWERLYEPNDWEPQMYLSGTMKATNGAGACYWRRKAMEWKLNSCPLKSGQGEPQRGPFRQCSAIQSHAASKEAWTSVPRGW